MKRLLTVLFLSLIIVQMCLLPLAVEGNGYIIICPTAFTQPATDLGVTTATLNGNVILPTDILDSMSERVVLASSQYATARFYSAIVSFKYGTQPGVYDHETSPVTILLSGPVQAQISGLNPCTNYYYLLKLHPLDRTVGRF